MVLSSAEIQGEPRTLKSDNYFKAFHYLWCVRVREKNAGSFNSFENYFNISIQGNH